MHIAQKFEALLETYRRPDGRKWSGQEIDEATGGVVSRSYVTNLRKGRIENPGYAKLAAMAKAMGFPVEVWFEDGLGEGRSIGQAEESRGLSARLEHLFEVVRNPKTGEPYTNTEVARMTLGDLSGEEVERIRAGAISDPTVGQVAALASVFGVEPSYLFDRKEPYLLDEELVRALRDEDATRLPPRDAFSYFSNSFVGWILRNSEVWTTMFALLTSVPGAGDNRVRQFAPLDNLAV